MVLQLQRYACTAVAYVQHANSCAGVMMVQVSCYESMSTQF